jgi:hypothetical protein
MYYIYSTVGPVGDSKIGSGKIEKYTFYYYNLNRVSAFAKKKIILNKYIKPVKSFIKDLFT